MMTAKIIDPATFLQAHFARAFMSRHNLCPKEFLALDSEKDILGFLRDGYEPFHLTGDEGVMEELDNYVYG